jgi:hypothetical protein
MMAKTTTGLIAGKVKERSKLMMFDTLPKNSLASAIAADAIAAK